jgi:hypothetical protein
MQDILHLTDMRLFVRCFLQHVLNPFDENEVLSQFCDKCFFVIQEICADDSTSADEETVEGLAATTSRLPIPDSHREPGRD